MRDQPAQLFAKHNVRLHSLVGFGVEAWHVHGVAHRTVDEVITDGFSHLNPHTFLCFLGAGTEVRGHHNVRLGT